MNVLPRPPPPLTNVVPLHSISKKGWNFEEYNPVCYVVFSLKIQKNLHICIFFCTFALEL